MSRLREGRANTARGAAHFLRETVGRVRYGRASGQLTVRADSGFYAHTVVDRLPGNGCPLLYHHPPARQPAGPDRGDTRGGLESHSLLRWTAPPMSPRLLTPRSRPSRMQRRCKLIVRRVKPTPGSQLALFARYSYHAFITDRGRRDSGTGGRPSPPRRGREHHKRPQVRRRAEPHAIGALRRQRRLAGGPGNRTQPGPLDGADWSGRTDHGHQDPQATGLRSGGTDHPLGTPPHIASPPALALGYPVQSRPEPACEPFHSRPDGQPVANSMSPQTRATPVRGSSLLLIPWPSAHRSSPRWPLGPCATTEDPPPTSHLPQQTTSHLPCSSLIPPYAVLYRQSVDSG